MAKTPIGDRLIRALETIDELQETIGKHAKIFSILTDKMTEMDKRLAEVEKATKR
jgi:septation ring formation regulator EzrA